MKPVNRGLINLAGTATTGAAGAGLAMLAKKLLSNKFPILNNVSYPMIAGYGGIAGAISGNTTANYIADELQYNQLYNQLKGQY